MFLPAESNSAYRQHHLILRTHLEFFGNAVAGDGHDFVLIVGKEVDPVAEPNGDFGVDHVVLYLFGFTAEAEGLEAVAIFARPQVQGEPPNPRRGSRRRNCKKSC